MSRLPSEQEEADLKKLHEDLAKEKDSFSSLVLHYLDMDETMLKHCGHKTNEGAIFHSSKAHKKKLLDLTKAHIKKYPD